MRTQWRYGFSGRTGLDHAACIASLRLRLRTWRREAPAVFGELDLQDLMDDVQVIESATLEADGEQRAADEAARQAQR